MRTACWITDVTDTHSQYVILIAFPQQQWLRERTSMLRHKYIAYLVKVCCYRLETTTSLHFQPETGLTSEQAQTVRTKTFLTMHVLIIQIHCRSSCSNHGDKSLISIRHIRRRRFCGLLFTNSDFSKVQTYSLKMIS